MLFKERIKIIIPGICFLLVFLFVISGSLIAGSKTVKLAYVEWSSAIATTNMAKAVLQEKLDCNCEMIRMKADQMWQAIADGRADAMMAAWLPELHDHYWQEYKDQVENLGPNFNGTRSGLVVPNVTLGRQTAATGLRNKPYITVNSISEIENHAEKFHYTIEGIDPEAGIMKKTEEAMEAYGLHEFDLVKGSEKTMTKVLSEAIRKQRWIVVTGWVPHWMFARWELKFLEDPQNIYGDKPGHIDTVARKGLKQDMPKVYKFLDKFRWSPEQLGQLMIWIHDGGGMYPYEKAMRYLRTHPEQVQSWLP